MQARDSSGRQVSLLNDEIYSHAQRLTYRTISQYRSSRGSSAAPNTPELLRSDSYDSQASNDAISPLTPTIAYEYRRDYSYPSAQHSYDDQPSLGTKRPAFAGDSRSNSYEDDSSPLPDRPGKRYPCRYRESHGCDKTFTTSGHASRHSKIHTAEKAVQCSFSGCQKKFTRADNMKQHLETHYKDKSRSSGSARPPGRSHGVTSSRRSSSSGGVAGSGSGNRRSSSFSRNSPLPSPGTSSGAWDLRDLDLPLPSRPSAGRTPSSGLDALAMAVACQEGG